MVSFCQVSPPKPSTYFSSPSLPHAPSKSHSFPWIWDSSLTWNQRLRQHSNFGHRQPVFFPHYGGPRFTLIQNESFVMYHKFQVHSIVISITYAHHHKPLHSKSCRPVEAYSKKPAHYLCAEDCASQEPHISTKSDFTEWKKMETFEMLSTFTKR